MNKNHKENILGTSVLPNKKESNLEHIYEQKNHFTSRHKIYFNYNFSEKMIRNSTKNLTFKE